MQESATVMAGVVKAGHRVTNSYLWYLNHGCNNYGDGIWESFYINDPLNFVAGLISFEEVLFLVLS